jgi:hypothetical protein
MYRALCTDLQILVHVVRIPDVCATHASTICMVTARSVLRKVPIKIQLSNQTTEMNLTTVVEILNTRLDELCPVNNCFFGIEPSMNKYRVTQQMIQACGHDTEEFQKAIQSATEALANLEKARKTAVLKFKTEGVCFCVDGQKFKEIELASLQ